MPKKAKGILAAGIVTAIAIGVTTFVNPGVANAANCPDNVLCLYEHSSWGGNFMILTRSTSDIGHAFNDKTSSFSNHTNQKWCLFQDNDYEGRKLLTIMPKTASSTVGSDANDRTSSVTYHSLWC